MVCGWRYRHEREARKSSSGNLKVFSYVLVNGGWNDHNLDCCWGKNGYDEVNIQNVRRRKRKTFFDKYIFEIDSSLRKDLRRKHETSDKSSKRVATQRPSLATKLEPKLGRYVATERSFRSVPM
ncbi:hypothetical protein F2Q68_00014232 [Brassica cretica]|uniref:Uncharacterized protein n=1 Tax=Brassica cretica TaxID=69181 RepID=A0A8S9HKE1_BRACR|nr:hypothetical protein F2Q68_00014232 [Brassica cretica]